MTALRLSQMIKFESPNSIIAACRCYKVSHVTPGDVVDGPRVVSAEGANALPRWIVILGRHPLGIAWKHFENIGLLLWNSTIVIYNLKRTIIYVWDIFREVNCDFSIFVIFMWQDRITKDQV